jgi:hypothetical protein
VEDCVAGLDFSGSLLAQHVAESTEIRGSSSIAACDRPADCQFFDTSSSRQKTQNETIK